MPVCVCLCVYVCTCVYVSGPGMKEMGCQEARGEKNQDDSKMGWMAGMPTEEETRGPGLGEIGWVKMSKCFSMIAA